MKAKVTIKEAAFLVGRHTRAIYRWIDAGRLVASKDGDQGELLVATDDVLKVEADTRRGRPRTVHNAQ